MLDDEHTSGDNRLARTSPSRLWERDLRVGIDVRNLIRGTPAHAEEADAIWGAPKGRTPKV